MRDGDNPCHASTFSLAGRARVDLQRSGFEWGHDFTWPHAEHWTGLAGAQTWPAPEPLARRCVFVREQALLLTNVFLDLPGNNLTADTH